MLVGSMWKMMPRMRNCAAQVSNPSAPLGIPMRRTRRIVCHCGAQAMKKKLDLAPRADEVDNLDQSAGNVSQDRSDRDPAKTHHRKPGPAARERETGEHVHDIDSNHRQRRRYRISSAAKTCVGAEHQHQERKREAEDSQIVDGISHRRVVRLQAPWADNQRARKRMTIAVVAMPAMTDATTLCPQTPLANR